MHPLETAARLAASAKDAPELNRDDVPPSFARGVAEAAAWIEAQIRMVPVEDEFQRGVRAGLEAAAKAFDGFRFHKDTMELVRCGRANVLMIVPREARAQVQAAIRTLSPDAVTDGGGDV